MKFTLRDDVNAVYTTGTFSGVGGAKDDKARLEVSVSTGYTEKLLPEEWDELKGHLADNYQVFRNALITAFASAAVWDTLTTISKKALVRNHVWKSAETTVNLDLLYTQAERDQYKEIAVDLMDDCDCDFGKSPNGTYWNVVPDDTGARTSTALTTDQVI